jgi:hypothetical protein
VAFGGSRNYVEPGVPYCCAMADMDEVTAFYSWRKDGGLGCFDLPEAVHSRQVCAMISSVVSDRTADRGARKRSSPTPHLDLRSNQDPVQKAQNGGSSHHELLRG